MAHQLPGLGQPVDTCVIANLAVNGEKFNAVLRWGDEYLSRWTLLVGHMAGITTATADFALVGRRSAADQRDDREEPRRPREGPAGR